MEKKPTTLPFGCLAAGKLVEAHVVESRGGLERLSLMIYLGPMHSGGGGCFGILAQDAKVGLSDVEIKEIRHFQSFRAITPCKRPKEDLEPLLRAWTHLPNLPQGQSILTRKTK